MDSAPGPMPASTRGAAALLSAAASRHKPRLCVCGARSTTGKRPLSMPESKDIARKPAGRGDRNAAVSNEQSKVNALTLWARRCVAARGIHFGDGYEGAEGC